MTRNHLKVLARGLLLGLASVAATYGLLVDIPFTYQAVIRGGLLPWLPAAVRGLPWALLAAALGNLALEGRPSSRWDLARIRRLGLAGAALGGLVLGWGGWLRSLEPGPAATGTVLMFLLAGAALLTLDLIEGREAWPLRAPEADDARRLFLAFGLTSLLVATTFFTLGAWRAAGAGTGFGARLGATTLAWSLLSHGLLGAMAAVAALGVQAAAGFFPRFRWAEGLLTLGAITLLTAQLLRTVVFPGLAFSGSYATLVSALLGYGVAAFLAFAGSHLGRAGGPVGSALEVFLRPFHPVQATGAGFALGLLPALGMALFVAFGLSRFDWNYLFQQLGALLVAALIFAPIYLRLSAQPSRHSWSPRLFAAPLLLLGLLRLWGTPLAQPSGWIPRPLSAAVERHAGFDASARLAGALLRAEAPASAGIYRLLLANSNLPQSLNLQAKDLKLVEALVPATGDRPDIYVFVVDSLRQDYLGAYNPRVTFTPALDRFARESTVFPKAFSRYGATGLSEPSIWVGGMILHRQYIVPFHPLNTLQKLVEADGYRPILSMDSILDVVVKPTQELVRLDAAVTTADLRLGRTLDDLQRQLDRLPADRPVFVYSQSQDIHISSINREGKDVPGGGAYPGFYAPYAGRVHRIDAQFGAFIQYLKDRGRYDRSLIIVTADHGDSLGEDGRFGHAYTLFPEILKVPLIIHVPEKLRTGLLTDPSRAAFLTDLTPTLYYLLGHRPLASDPVLGRPLFTATKAEQDRFRRDHHLVASSYGAVWGIVTDDGNGLYISDGVNFADHFFDLGADPKGARNGITPELKRRYDRLIVDEIQHLNTFYGFRNGS